MALFLSGVAAIINQTAWQRSLKVFLGGSEALSSMIVVAVFIGGLALGAQALRNRARSIGNPMLALGWIEVGLGLVAVCVMGVFTLGLEGTVATIHSIGTGLGLPRRMVFGFGAVAVLGVPCFLMGLTVPLAAEACQRQLQATRPRVLAWVAFANTLGAVGGALVSGYLLIPYLGLAAAMSVAIAANLGAGLLLVGGRFAAAASAIRSRRAKRVVAEDYLGAILGFASLGYEMQLFRLFSLTLEPLPYTFAGVLATFLAVWSAGVGFAAVLPGGVVGPGVVAAVGLFLTPSLYALDPAWRISVTLWGLGYFVPVFAFGCLYARLMSRCRNAWGEDVGAFCAANSLGSCLGAVFFTVVGYSLPFEHNSWLMGLVTLGGVLAFDAFEKKGARAAVLRSTATALLAGGVILLGALGLPASTFRTDTWVGFFSPDGVVEIRRKVEVYWDGLWHARLTDGRNHIGNSHWLSAVAPLLAGDLEVRDALVIGMGSGITVGTLSKAIPKGKVEVYEINPGLKPLLEEFRTGTLSVIDLKNVSILWLDARSGLALSPKKYDLITQMPLYLRQSGSGLLLSVEYMRLIKSRLSMGGVFCIYSNATGAPGQSRLIRATASAVFDYVESVRDGYLVLASDRPFDLGAMAIQRRTALFPDLAGEFELAAGIWGGIGFDALVDRPMPSADAGGFLITDDHPLVEYPDVVSRLLPAPKGK